MTDDLAGPGIQDSSQEDEAAGDGDIGQVRYPELMRAIGNDILGQVGGINRSGMVAVGCHDVAPALFWLQIVLAHQASELLTVHHHALVA